MTDKMTNERMNEYACPLGLDPRRWCDVELRHPDMWGDLRCARCGWQGADIPQESRYQWAGFASLSEREEPTP